MHPRFTADTIVADAIAADPGVIDRLAVLSPIFRKLRNPVLRKTMARLVTLGDAARVAGLPLEAVLASANGDEPAVARTQPTDVATEQRPPWMDDIDLAAADTLDVRPTLARGDEPLGEIMRKAATIPEGGVLLIEAPFDPAPLRRVLGRKGFVSFARRLDNEHWRITFYRNHQLARKDETQYDREIPRQRIWLEDDGPHIDVRGLDPPEPMVMILELLEKPDTGAAVTVHHEREPLFLYPELAERGWSHALIPGDEGEVRLRLERADRA